MLFSNYILFNMPKLYHAVPLDEEQQHLNGSLEKETRFLSTREDRQLLGLLAKHWMWLGHAVLLSMSLTLFTLSFCQRTARPSDLTVTEQFSSYCKWLAAPLPLFVTGADLSQRLLHLR